MSGELERFSSAQPSKLVCSRCWTSFFSTSAFRELFRIQEEEGIFGYTVTSSEIEKSAAAGCNWCRLILSQKQDADELTLGSGHPSSTELHIKFGSIPTQIIKETFTPSGSNRFGLWINGASYYVTAFTDSEDPVSECVTARELDHRVNSSVASHQIQKWLKECDDHKHCPQKRRHILPSRVIDVCPERDPDTPRLLATSGLVGYYTALSYCWGTNQKGVTMKINLKSRLQQLDMHSLSRTIQDAILLTREIGVKYLWVDAICIIQDSEDDKVAELSVMCNIYQQALVTIVAANAKDANQGFLSDRDPPSPSTKIPFWSPDGKLGSISLKLEGWYDDETEPVNTRAWTLQERLLSPRLLIYASHTLQYQCQHHTVNLGGSINIPSGFGSWRLPLSFLDPSFGRLPEVLDVQSAGRMWEYIISMYSQRHLSYIEDKLTALAGIAEAFHARMQVEYLAGLWSGELLSRLLLWEAAQTTDYLPCPVYTAPSWSWASLASPVRYSEIYNEHTYEWYHIKDLAAHMILRSKELPFGRVTGGHLKLSAHVKLGSFQPPQYILWDKPLGKHGVNETLYSVSTARLDSSVMDETPVICLAIVRRTYEPKGDDKMSMNMVQVAFPSASVQEGATLTAVDGLIIFPAGNDCSYRRIGSFHGADEKEFEDCPRWTVTLI